MQTIIARYVFPQDLFRVLTVGLLSWALVALSLFRAHQSPGLKLRIQSGRPNSKDPIMRVGQQPICDEMQSVVAGG